MPHHLPATSRRLTVAAAALCATLAPAAASATDLSGALSVDNAFTLYLSTDDSVAGTPLLTGQDWQVTSSLNATTLGPAPVYYLHVVAQDFGPPATFLGSFALSDSAYQFANGTQTLVTNTADWTVRLNGFGDADATPISRGFNGVSPWGVRPGITTSAEQIWSSDECGLCTRYFSTTITATVPEPGTYALMALGLAAVGAAARRARG